MAHARPFDVVAVLRSSTGAASLRAACAGMSAARVSVHVGALADLTNGAGGGPRPDVLLLEIDPREGTQLEAAEHILRTHFPSVPVIASAPEASLDGVRRLMRLGIVDFLPEPISGAELEVALDHALRVHPARCAPAKAPGKVVAFLKSGGGVGATTLAAQSACHLSARHAHGDAGVCLLDFDVQFGNAALYLDLHSQAGLADLLDAPDRIDGALLRGVMAHHDSGLDVLAAPRDMIPLGAVAPDFAGECLALARAEYGLSVLDLPGAWTDWTHALARQCDLVVLVTQLTVPAIRRARRQLDTMEVHGLSGVPLRIALNRHERGWRRRVWRAEAEAALVRGFDFLIANDYRAISEAINRGVPVRAVKRWSRVGGGIRRMADGLAAVLAEGAMAARAGGRMS